MYIEVELEERECDHEKCTNTFKVMATDTQSTCSNWCRDKIEKTPQVAKSARRMEIPRGTGCQKSAKETVKVEYGMRGPGEVKQGSRSEKFKNKYAKKTAKQLNIEKSIERRDTIRIQNTEKSSSPKAEPGITKILTEPMQSKQNGEEKNQEHVNKQQRKHYARNREEQLRKILFRRKQRNPTIGLHSALLDFKSGKRGIDSIIKQFRESLSKLGGESCNTEEERAGRGSDPEVNISRSADSSAMPCRSEKHDEDKA